MGLLRQPHPPSAHPSRESPTTWPRSVLKRPSAQSSTCAVPFPGLDALCCGEAPAYHDVGSAICQDTGERLSIMPVQEQDVARIWAEVIGIPEADVDTNFFDLGGHSLQLMELADRLNQKLDISTDILALMEYPTVAAFTSHWNSVESLADGDR
ncbi:acyl carrier protein [Streptomyces radicis]|uniref:Acyl carrier protein n=2 Tax=Streptomyces radicis TaxID=1750517 RepID=A0A3A9W435_9ACTN|nr:acyl carrier protein [Streptomyces radicis]RKN18333.1 acyl carrier protein [Streptomyces radicis]